jgi:phosphonate transport system substrate-binding protein
VKFFGQTALVWYESKNTTDKTSVIFAKVSPCRYANVVGVARILKLLIAFISIFGQICKSKMMLFYRIIPLFVLILFAACNSAPRDVKVIDASDAERADISQIQNNSEGRTLKVAVSPILSPRETYHSYESLFRYISEQTGIPIEFHQRRTYHEINQMLEAGQLDFAFICSGAYVELDRERGTGLLAVPECNGSRFYKSYIITHASSAAQQFDDLRGSSFAFTDPMSNSGRLYIKHRLQQEGRDVESFFGSTLYTYGHDLSIQMVQKGIVEAASVSNLVYDFLKAKDPERVSNIRILEVSEDFGMPPVIYSRRMTPNLREKIRTLFMQMHNDNAAATILDDLLIDRFHPGDDDEYNSIRLMRQQLPN